MQKSKERIDKFLSFENDYNLFELQIKSVYFWQIIRKSVYRKYILEDELHPISSTKKRYLSDLKHIIYQFPHFVFKNPVFIKKEADVLILNHQRRVKYDNLYYCLYTDSIVEKLKRSNVILEKKYLNHHYKPVPNNNLYYLDYITFMTAVKRRILDVFKLNKVDTDIVNNLRNQINKVFNVKIDKNNFIKLIKTSVNAFIIDEKYYSKLIKKIRPKIILEVVHYEETRFVINHLAKKKNIPTVELQHGTMGPYHIAYNFKKRFELSMFPDYIFTFGEYWKNATRFPINPNNIIEVGWPYLEKRVSKNLGNVANKDKKNILFISQDGQTSKSLFELAKALSNTLEKTSYEIIYKLHPKEYPDFKKTYSGFKSKNLTFISNNDNDIHYFLNNCDYLIGVASTVLFEAIAYGIKPMVLNVSDFEYMENLLENDLASLVKNEEDVLMEIEKDRYLDKNKVNYYWKQNSIDNILTNIEKIISD